MMPREEPPERGPVLAGKERESMQMISVRVWHDDYIEWRREARASDLSFAEWLRRSLNAAVG